MKEGEWVEQGALIGLCGNSGYSPQPHIHIQVQAEEQIGYATMPFSFVSYLVNGQYFANAVPNEGEQLESLHEDKGMGMKMTYLLDDEWRYEVFENDVKQDEFSLKTSMDAEGTMYVSCGDSRIYFGKSESTFYQYRMTGKNKYLKMMFMALPRMPLIYVENMSWEDTIPIGMVLSPFKAALFRFLSSFNHQLAHVVSVSRFVSPGEITTEISYSMTGLKNKAQVVLGEEQGIKMIMIGNLKFVRAENEEKMVADTVNDNAV